MTMNFKNNDNMKKTYLLLAAAVLVFVCSVVGFVRYNAPTYSTSFYFKVTSKAMIVEVTYNPDQSPQVERYIDSCLQPEVVFGSRHKVNTDVQISSSRLKYQVKASPGELKMTADKNSNSESSLNRLKSIFDGLKSVIKAD
jgi:hypothetical protein